MEATDIEVHELTNHSNGTWEETGHEFQSLPRADGGKQAWLFLSACFVLEALIWGFPFSYGVFQAYYSTHQPFAENKSGISSIGTTQTGIMYFSCPLVALAGQRWPRLRRPGMFLGVALMVLSLVAASFCNSVNGLLATQGVMYALGGSILYFPGIQFVDEWFIARKGLAFGIMWAGTGSAGIVVPFLLQYLLDDYGFRTALRVWAIVLALGMTFCLIFVKGRLPITSSNAMRPIDFTFLKRSSFWLLEFGAILQSLAFFLPAFWIPTFSQDIGLPKFSGPLSLALLNLAACGGAVLMGVLVDRYHISVGILVSTIGEMVAIFIFWGLTTSQPMLYMFALVWGLFGGGFSSSWSGYGKALAKKHPTMQPDTGLILGFMAAGRGVGAVITGPLSEKLLESGWSSQAKFAISGQFGILIVFSGLTAMLGGVGSLGKVLKIL